jgi:hypothetical protein
MFFQGKQARAHRVQFYLTNGFYPEAVMHKCDNTKCVNPRHLKAGDNAKNACDMAVKGRVYGQKVALTDAQVEEIRASYVFRTVGCKRLGEKYGVSPETIRDIVTGKNRKTTSPDWGSDAAAPSQRAEVDRG